MLFYKAGGISASKAGIRYVTTDNSLADNEKDLCNFGKGGSSAVPVE
ncbi:MAG TPA: hypothetical protein VFX50_01625 [Gemmatimonadales bacterium]|nr:hypothetical protein [Gemmatimonadales bacterium]